MIFRQLFDHESFTWTYLGARALAPLLERELGMPVVVQNRPGAGSQIGMAQVARARPGQPNAVRGWCLPDVTMLLWTIW